jgi:hypothetical protein
MAEMGESPRRIRGSRGPAAVLEIKGRLRGVGKDLAFEIGVNRVSVY